MESEGEGRLGERVGEGEGKEKGRREEEGKEKGRRGEEGKEKGRSKRGGEGGEGK